MELNISRAETDHIEDIRQIAKSCWAEICDEAPAPDDIGRLIDEEYLPGKLREQIESANSWFYILMDAGRTVGFAHMVRKADKEHVGLVQKLFAYSDYQEYKIVYRLFQHLIEKSSAQGITEMEIYYPECAKKWIQIFTQIGLEFEPWRKFDKKVGTRDITMWPGLLVIVPDF